MAQSKPILLKTIYTVAESLGAKTISPRALPKTLTAAPKFIAEYHCNFVWPKRRQYDAPESSKIVYGPDMMAETLDMSCINLGSSVQRMPDDYDVPDTDDMEIYGIGTEGGGNYILLLDGRDSKPRNPTVYSLDHEMQSGPLAICDLLQFLKLLVPST